MSSDNREVSLLIGGKAFKVKKDVICTHSDYFRAMFSGNYVEQEKQDIIINVVDSNSMAILLRYMEVGSIDLSKFSIPDIGNLALAANFLQITKIDQQIQSHLDLQLSISNWVEIMMIAEVAAYPKLEQLAATFGLLSFKEMKPQYIPTLSKLFWYLSNPSLNAETEVEVYRFGMEWVLHPNTCSCADILLIIVTCLDVKRLTSQDIKEISILIKDCENSLAGKVVDCLKMLLDNKLELDPSVLLWHSEQLCETFSVRIFNEVYNIVKGSLRRNLTFTPVVPIWTLNDGKLQLSPHHMYTFTPAKGFQKSVEVASKLLWGWSVTSWGLTKLLVVGGEYGRGSGQFITDIKVYDTLRKTWTQHGVKLPPRRHSGVTVCGDILYIVGGVGCFRVLQDSVITYDLKQRTFENVASFPDAIQSPAICTHYDTVYAASQKDVYKYETDGEKDEWRNILSTQIRPNRLISYGEYIYCTQNYFSPMYRFRPGIDTKLQMVTQFSAPPAAFANLRNRLMVFTKTMCGHQTEQFRVEEFKGPCNCKDTPCTPGAPGCGPEVVLRHKTPDITVNDVAGACALVMDIPKIYHNYSRYHRHLISRYGHITYNDST